MVGRRTTFRTVVRHPSAFEDWWIDLPLRSGWWWREVMFAPGAGWLKWKSDWREHISYDPPDKDEWVVYPPLHRAWLAVMGFVLHPWWVIRGDCRWTEWPTLQDVSILRDDEREKLFR